MTEVQRKRRRKPIVGSGAWKTTQQATEFARRAWVSLYLDAALSPKRAPSAAHVLTAQVWTDTAYDLWLLVERRSLPTERAQIAQERKRWGVRAEQAARLEPRDDPEATAHDLH